MKRIKDYLYRILPININAQRRERWIRECLTALPRGLRILDAGAGEAPYRDCCAGQEYVTQDFAQYDGQGDGVGLQTGSWDQTKIDVVSDIVSIPVPDASFDVVICTEVFEHIPDPLAALRELTRVLKKGGTLIVTAPFASMTHFAPYHFFTGFSRYFYEEHFVRRNGYALLEVTPNGSFFESVGEHLLLTPRFCRRYVHSFFGYLLLVFIVPFVLVLRLLARYDRGSSELLCFGYFVRAEKRQ